METLILILFAEQATPPPHNTTMQIFVYIFGPIAIFAVCWIVYMLLSEVKEERATKRRSYAVGQAIKYMDDVASKDYEGLDSKYEKKDAKPKRR